MNFEQKFENVVKKTNQYFEKNGYKKAVIGVSGGIDSALTLLVTKNALGSENVTALLMPNTKISSKEGVKHAAEWCEKLNVKFVEYAIDDFVKTFQKVDWDLSDYAEMNINARSRMILLYSYANSNNALVVGTGNKTELMIGYFTKYGDGGVDLLPIGDLYKTEVKEIAKLKKVPVEIIEKEPTAELYHGQLDEDEIGGKYEEIDKILQAYEKNVKAEEIKKKFNPEFVEKILKMVESNRHKTKMPFVVK